MRKFSRFMVYGALLGFFAAVPMACSSGGTGGGTGNAVTPTGEPVRVPIMIINRSANRLPMRMVGIELEIVLPSSQICVLLPQSVDGREISLGNYTVSQRPWSSQVGWQVEIPESSPSNRLTALPAAPCQPE